MKTKTKIVSMVASILACPLIIGTAQAGALATSTVQLNNFIVTDVTTNTQLDAGQLGSLNYTSTANLSNTLGINSLASAAPAPPTSAGSDLYIQQGTPTPAYTNNSFAVISSTTGQPLSNYVISDSLEKGSPVTNLHDYLGSAYTSPATVDNATYASLATSGSGNASSTNTVGAGFTWIASTNDALKFSFNLTTYLEAFVTNGSINPTAANASYNIVFTLTDKNATTGVVSTLLSNSISDTVTATSTVNNGVAVWSIASDSALGIAKLQTIALTSLAMTAGDTINFSANVTSTANALAVNAPEPGVLALLGLGLIGMANVRRRQA